MNKKKQIIGYTTGVFDLFHIGHLNILKRAKSMCDYLIVGVSTDENVYGYKSKYPVIPYSQRAEIIRSLKYVDEVVPQENMDKIAAWEKLRFDRIFHGDDWKNTELYVTIKEKLEAKGVEVIYFPYTKSVSTTEIKNAIINNTTISE